MSKQYNVVTNLIAKTGNFIKGMNDASNKANSFSKKFANGMQTTSKSIHNFGSKIQSIGKSFNNVGDQLTRKITMPATAAVTALTGITLVKGFNRLAGIDTAQAKLKALGHDAESVTEIMDSALSSVRGTAYGLDEAATTAASAVAAGIEPGKELTKYLSLTGDAAAIAGDNLSGMGSIFNKVQTAQRAYTGDLNMLSDRGIPIYQWLAEEAGTTAEAVRDMASSGEVSSQMFLNAIDKNIGGAAKTMGESSFMASIANIGADISRIGANFLDAGGQAGGFFSTMKPLLTEFRGYLSNIEEKAADLGAKFGEVFNNLLERVAAIKARFDSLSPSMQGIILKVAGIGAAIAVGIGPALKIIGTLSVGFGALVKILAFFVSPIGLIVAGVVGLIAILTTAYATSEEFREKVNNAFDSVKTFVTDAIQTIREFWDEHGDAILAKATEIFTATLEIITSVINKAAEIIETALIFISEFWDEHGEEIISTVTRYINFVRGTLMDIIGKIVGFLKERLDIILQFWEENGEQILEASSNVFSTIWKIISFVVDKIVKAFDFFLPYIKMLFGNTWKIITSIIDGAVGMIMGIVKVLVGLFTGDFDKMKEGAIDIFKSLISMIKGVLQGAWGLLSAPFNFLLSKISGWFTGLKNKAINWGKNMIQGFIDGIKNMGSAVSNAAKGIISNATGFLGFRSPAKKGEGRHIVKFGSNMIDGFLDGVKSTASFVEKDMNKFVADKILNPLSHLSSNLSLNLLPQMATSNYTPAMDHGEVEPHQDINNTFQFDININGDVKDHEKFAKEIIERASKHFHKKTQSESKKIGYKPVLTRL